jgi:hypothetical protein
VNKLVPAAPRGAALRDDRAYEGLTPQQWHYARFRAAGSSVTEAYERAYLPDETLPRMTVHQMAAGVEANPKVQSKLRALLFEQHGDNSLIPKIDSDFVLTGIAQIAVTSTKDSTRLRGYELLGKAIGLFDTARNETPQIKTVTDIDAELKRRLSSALNPPVLDQPGDLEPSSPATSSPATSSPATSSPATATSSPATSSPVAMVRGVRRRKPRPLLPASIRKPGAA